MAHNTYMSYIKELKVALEAVRRASYLTHKVAQGKNVSAIKKEDNSPVTLADFAAQAVISSAIRAAFPEDPIVGEEDSDEIRGNERLSSQLLALAREFAPSDTRFHGDDTEAATKLCDAIDFGTYAGSPTGRQWALDPVDGTKGFLRGGQYAVCLALIVDSVVQVGVIGCPNLDEHGGIFYAVRGEGGSWEPLYPVPSHENPHHHKPRPLKFREIENPADAQFCESVESGHSALGQQSKIARELGLTKPAVRMDSQAKYCELARGEADIYLRLPVSLKYEEKIWDHAAGSLLITEAGGMVSDMYGHPLDFGQGRTLKQNKGIVASNRKLQPLILNILSSEQ